MAKSRAFNTALKGSKPSTFDPTAIITGFRGERDRQREKDKEDTKTKNDLADRELLLQERKSRIAGLKTLDENRKLQRQKLFKEMYGRDADVLEPTEFGSVNDVATRAVRQLTDTRNEVMRSIETGNNPEDRKKLTKIDASLSKIKLGYDAVKVISDKFIEMEANGTISGMDRDNWAQKIQNLKEGKASIQMDDNFNPIFVYHDNEGNPVSFDDVQELINGEIDVIEHYDVPTEMANLAKKLGTIKSTSALGGSFKGLGGGQKALLEKDVDAIVMDDSVVADVLYQMGGNKEGKRKGFTDDERDVVAARLLEQAIGSVSVETVADDPVEEELEVKEPVTPVTTTQGTQHVVVIGEGVDAKPYKVFNPRTSTTTNDGSNIDEILYNEETGGVILRGTKTNKIREVIKKDDDTGEIITTTEEGTKTEDIEVTDLSEVTNIITGMINPKTKEKFRTLTEFKDYITGGEKTEAQRLIEKYRKK